MASHTFPTVKGDLLSVFFKAVQATSDETALTGWNMLSADSIGFTNSESASITNGIYKSANATALLAEGMYKGHRMLIVGFQQTNDTTDALTDIKNINQHFTLFSPMVSKLNAEVATGAWDLVFVSGWSLGGAMAQMFMAGYKGIAPAYAMTIGSPGYLIPGGKNVADARIINYADGNDIFIAAGTERADTKTLSDTVLGGMASLLGLSASSVTSIKSQIDTDYNQRGTRVDVNGPYQDWASLRTKLIGGDNSPVASHANTSYKSKTAAAKVSKNPFDLDIGSKATATANKLFGTINADSLDGLAGNDVIRGREGADTLTGGDGTDRFVFDTTPGDSNVDTITDFAPGTDKLVLDDDVFTQLLGTKKGAAVTDGQFVLGTAAADSDDFVLFDNATGSLFYDADGSGEAVAVLVASLTVNGATAFGAADLLILS